MRTLIWIALLSMCAVNLFGRSIYKIENNSVIIDVEGISKKSEMLKIEILTPSVIKIVTGMKEKFSDSQSLISTIEQPPVKFKTAYSGTNVEIATKELIINVEENGLVRIFNREGNKLLIESDRFFSPSALDSNYYSITQKFFINMQEHIYGFGQGLKQSRYSLRNTSFEVKQTDSDIASPIFYSEKGYALIWDNYSPTNFADAKSGLQLSSKVADEIQYILIYGPDWDNIVSELRTISGKAKLLPRWAYGLWLSNEAIGNGESAETKLEKFHSFGIPVDINTDENGDALNSASNQITEPILPQYSLVQSYRQLIPIYQQIIATAKTRPCISTHIGMPGIQSYGAVTVSGNVPNCWSALQNQIKTGMNITLAGQPYWSTIIGGNIPSDCNGEPKDELLVRWYQFAAFTPIFQITQPNKEPWTVGKPGDAKFEAIKKAIVLRYQLLPYIYSTAYDVESKNSSIMRSLLFNDYKAEKTHTIENQYLFGPSLMVCPIDKPSATKTTVYLPRKNNWYNFWTGKYRKGGQEITLDASIDHIPVFVKEGSIIPIAEVYNTATDSLSNPMEIRVYPGMDAEFYLYEDENDGFGYKTEAFSTIKFLYREKDQSIEIGSVSGSFPNMPTTRQFKVVLVDAENGIGTNYSTSDLVKIIDYKGKKTKVKLK